MIQRPRGTTDRLPDMAPAWRLVTETFQRQCELRGFVPISTPTIERSELFTRTTGDATDLAQKEMYSFEDRGGDSLTLRSEGTAPVVRAYVQNGLHNLPQPVKLYYITPIFRYDRPQAGRYREHHQIGAEALGDASPAVDAEVIDLLWSTYRALGIDDLRLELNSLGDPDTRPAYRQALVDYFTPLADRLDSESRERLTSNPLRILDSKSPTVTELCERAPRSLDYLGEPALAHFQSLQALLESLEIAYTINHRLVRGLDYYNRTVFEFVPPDAGSQSTVGGGGRYDYLAELIGAAHVPGVGFGSGIERVLLNLERSGTTALPPQPIDVYVAPLADAAVAEAMRLARRLRITGVGVECGFRGASPRSHLRRASRSQARVAALIGQREMERGVVALKPLNGTAQVEVVQAEAVNGIQSVLAEET
ncbi:MAG: histidine--tRNA ligase [Chloroflexi bacterium]|nr:histidine--tRNA ligase [Chloroflexota bacterium]MCY3958788.1 histidine--tRNA ligase [Chloroflexota bacterium]